MSAAPKIVYTKGPGKPQVSLLENLKDSAVENAVPGRLTQPRRVYRLGVARKEPEYLQLLMRVRCRLANGRHKTLKILVDTGAQANLIREGLMP